MTRVVSLVLATTIAAGAGAQAQPGIALQGVDGAAAFNALAQECYDAGLWSEMPSDSIMDCAEPLDERAPAESPDTEPARPVVRHKVRFTLIERAGSGRIGAEAWTETHELGTVIEEPVTAEDYLARIQGVMTSVVARLRSGDRPPWADHFDSEQAWHLAAHLRAVSHCDENLASMTAASVGAELESVGLRALDEDTRDRCEQLYTHLFEWGLVRGDDDPTVQEYGRYRAALPAEQRTCSGQLARDAVCRR